MMKEMDRITLIHRSLQCCSLFSNWPEIAIARMARIGYLQRHTKHSLVEKVNPDENEVFVVASGCVEVSVVNEANTKFVLSLHSAGDVCALVALVSDFKSPYQVHAYEDTLLVHLPVVKFRQILDEMPLLWKEVALFIFKRFNGNLNLMHHRALGNLQQSLAETLLTLAESAGSRSFNRNEICLRVSQSDLAAMLSVSRQTINKELRSLMQLGLLNTDYGQLRLLNIPKLKELARPHQIMNAPTQNSTDTKDAPKERIMI